MSEEKNRMNQMIGCIRSANDMINRGDKAAAIYELETVVLLIDADISEKEQHRERIANQIARLRVDVDALRRVGGL